MMERNGAKIYLELSAYELGQLVAILPRTWSQQVDDLLRRKIVKAKDEATKDAAIESELRALANEHLAKDPLDAFNEPEPSADDPIAV